MPMISQYIDSHQHFWQYSPVKHDWITDDMSIIRKDFLPQDLAPLLTQNGVEGCIAVQAEQSEEETIFLLNLAEHYSFIKGVVGWIDLGGDAIHERLEYYQQYPTLCGFRHILQGEAPDYMLQPAFLKGIAALKEYGYTYDILIFPQHMDAATQLVAKFPEQKFVIDHMAKPFIKAGLIDAWKKGIRQLAQYPNVYCKISGMVTEADHQNWKEQDLTPYIDTVVEAFAIKRILYGSDWPVCLVAAEYARVIGTVRNYFSAFSITEQELFFRHNALDFYNLTSSI